MVQFKYVAFCRLYVISLPMNILSFMVNTSTSVIKIKIIHSSWQLKLTLEMKNTLILKSSIVDK